MMTHSPIPLPTTENPTGDQRKPARKKGLRPSRLWLFIWLAFALQITAWFFWVKLATKHPVQEVPLVTAQPSSAPLNSDARPTEARQIKPLEERGRGGTDAAPIKKGLRP